MAMDGCRSGRRGRGGDGRDERSAVGGRGAGSRDGGAGKPALELRYGSSWADERCERGFNRTGIHLARNPLAGCPRSATVRACDGPVGAGRHHVVVAANSFAPARAGPPSLQANPPARTGPSSSRPPHLLGPVPHPSRPPHRLGPAPHPSRPPHRLGPAPHLRATTPPPAPVESAQRSSAPRRSNAYSTNASGTPPTDAYSRLAAVLS